MRTVPPVNRFRGTISSHDEDHEQPKRLVARHYLLDYMIQRPNDSTRSARRCRYIHSVLTPSKLPTFSSLSPLPFSGAPRRGPDMLDIYRVNRSEKPQKERPQREDRPMSNGLHTAASVCDRRSARLELFTRYGVWLRSTRSASISSPTGLDRFFVVNCQRCSCGCGEILCDGKV